MEKEGTWADIASRINLQCIGTLLRDGSARLKINKSNFKEREEEAYDALEFYLEQKFDKKTINALLTEIVNYSGVLTDIYFSLGMKAGATLVLKLTDNFEIDF